MRIFTLMKLLLISITFLTFVTCKKSTDSNLSCFTNEVSSINMSTSCFSLTTIAHISSGQTVTIELNDSALNLNPTCSTYNIVEYPGDVVVKYYTYTYHPDSGYVELCTDAFYPRHRRGQKTTWSAVSGSVTAIVSKAAKDRQPRENYRMSMRLDNVKFVSANADTTISLVLKDKLVYSHIP